MAQQSSSSVPSPKYQLKFGLARQEVPLDADESRRLDQDMREALLELVAAAWGVSVDTYKSNIGVSSKAYQMDARNDLTHDADLQRFKGLVSDPLYAILEFLAQYTSLSKCKRAAPVRDTLLNDPECVEGYLKRLWNAIHQCFKLNQLFESNANNSSLTVMPESFFYSLRTFMNTRKDDDAACCQFGNEFVFVLSILVKSFFRSLANVFTELHTDTVSRGDGYSFEVPLFMWQYYLESKDETPPAEREKFRQVFGDIYQRKTKSDSSGDLFRQILDFMGNDGSHKHDQDDAGEPTND